MTKTGAGTASAVAEAKVTREDAAAWCAINMPHFPGCVNNEVQQGGDGARASYRATANCSTGEMNSINGYPYVYAGVWAQGAGQGRPMLRAQGPGGNIPQWESIRSGTGKARAEWDLFGGYSLTGQWEVLCGKAAPKVGGPQAAATAKPAPGAASETRGASEKEWLSLCSRCDNPTVFAKSGIGTANAVAQARSPETGNKVYRASANCMTGQIRTAQEQSFTLAGLWDNSDIGGGRTQWRGADGQIVKRDNASEGLAIAQQWELLCPAPVPATLLAQVKGGAAGPNRTTDAARPQANATGSVPPPVASACTGKRYCDEAGTFAAIVTDFRPSTSGPTRIVSATVRFLNKTNRPLILGYVRNGAVAIDEQGNRYEAGLPESVRGMGEVVNGGEFDPKFTIAPGQTSDARVEFSWRWNGRDIIGQRAWDIDFTVREVNEVAPRQYRFGQEHALHFKAVPGRNTMTEAAGAGALTSAVPVGAPSGPLQPSEGLQQHETPASQNPAPAPQADACGGKSRCYDAGPFVAEIAQAIVIR
ncbi:MAG: hypothetical protein ABJC09_07375, partial [Terriglobia bacterium]